MPKNRCLTVISINEHTIVRLRCAQQKQHFGIRHENGRDASHVSAAGKTVG